jgi:hypothetical protein
MYVIENNFYGQGHDGVYYIEQTVYFYIAGDNVVSGSDQWDCQLHYYRDYLCM